MMIFPNTAPQEIRGTGSLVNQGPGTVYYSDRQDFTQPTAQGQISSGGTLAIDGTLWLIGGPAQVEVMQVPAVTGKRVTLPIGSDGVNTNSAASKEYNNRALVVLPVTTSRWRMRGR